MSVDLLVFHHTPVVSDTTPVAMAPLQPGGIQGVSLPLLLVSRELRYFDLCEILQLGNLEVLLHLATVVLCWPNVKSLGQGVC